MSGKMTDEPSTITYMVTEPFQQALRSVRRALSARDLRIGGELDVADRIRRGLLIGTAPCALLLVWPRAALAQLFRSDPVATAIVPLHVVVSGRGSRSEVHILRPLSYDGHSVGWRALSALNQMQAEIGQSIEKIGMRVTLSA